MKKLFFLFLLAFLCGPSGFCDSKSSASEQLAARVSRCGDFYPNHGVENSLDGNPDDNYTSFRHLNRPTVFELALSRPVAHLGISAIFGSRKNYAKNWQVEALDEDRRVLCISPVAGKGKKQLTRIYAPKPFRHLRFTFREFAGQDRLLLRQLTFKDLSKSAPHYPVAGEDFSVKILHVDPCYEQYGLENSLDGQWADDYTAFTESAVPAHIDMELTKPQKRLNLEIIFESKANYATAWQVDLLDEQGKKIRSIPVKGSGQHSFNLLTADQKFRFLRLAFTDFSGQKRLLLRQLTLSTDFMNDRFFQPDLRGEKRFSVACIGKSPAGIMSIAKYDKDCYLMLHDRTICSFDAAKQVLTPVKVIFSPFKQTGENRFYQPAGIAVAENGKVYIANGQGNNVLQGQFDPGKKTIVLEREYRGELCRGPKNVAVDLPRKMLFSANHDSGTITAFDLVSGRELWAAPVPQAQGVTFDENYVYATGSGKHNLVKIELKNGKIVQEIGRSGWNAARRQFLRPVMQDRCNDDTLIVTDADTGFISLIDKKTLQVKKFFGGNGCGRRYFNYPHVAKVLGDEIWISSAFRPEILVLDRKKLKSLRRYVFRNTISRGEQSEPTGIGWKNYINYQDSGQSAFMGKQYRAGFGLLYHPDNIFTMPRPGTLFCPSSQPVCLLQNHVEGNVTFLWSSSSPHLFMLVDDPADNFPGAFFSVNITEDSWKDGDCIVTEKEKIKFSSLAAQAEKKYQRLRRLQEKCRIILPMTMKEFLAEELTPAEYKNLFDSVFASYPGVRFKDAYDRYCRSDPDKVREAARLYYGRTAQASGHKNLAEYLFVSMLTGVNPEDKLFPPPPKVINPDASDLKYFKLCIAVSRLKPYGAGEGPFSYATRAELRRNIVSCKDWHCGHFALQFCLDLPAEAKPVCYGLEQPASGAHHALVEVREPVGIITYDPTQGCAYRASVKQMREGSVNMEDVTLWGKEPKREFVFYQGADFFFNVNIQSRIKFYEIKEK